MYMLPLAAVATGHCCCLCRLPPLPPLAAPAATAGCSCHRCQMPPLCLPLYLPTAAAAASSGLYHRRSLPPPLSTAASVNRRRRRPLPPSMVDPGAPRPPRLVSEALGMGAILAELAAILAAHYQTVSEVWTARTP